VRVALIYDINKRYLMKGEKHIPDTDSNGKFALSVPAILGAGGEGAGVTARDDDEDFECPCNQPLTLSFSELLPLDMDLQTVCLATEGSVRTNE
jgi:hypothetical protein